MTPHGTIMAAEIASVPEVVAAQLSRRLEDYLAAGRRLADLAPPCVVTGARGSSDHAAAYFKYLVETRVGIPVCSMGPSVASVYEAPLRLEGLPLLAVSQSGASADLLALTERAAAGGAPTLALVNDTASPLAGIAETVLPMEAGVERAVAATKTHVCSLVALAAMVAGWTSDQELTEALRRLPERLHTALACDWSSAQDAIAHADDLFVVSRGPALAVAREIALKFEETCRLHAQAYSAAELRHGPIALAGVELVALVLATSDQGAPSIAEAVEALRATGARAFVVGGEGRDALPSATGGHPLLDPIAQVLSSYRFLEALAVSTGHDPDAPAHLSKVTVTR